MDMIVKMQVLRMLTFAVRVSHTTLNTTRARRRRRYKKTGPAG